MVSKYNQQTNQYEVNYEDSTTVFYNSKEVMNMIRTFEFWYTKVFCGGRTMTRQSLVCTSSRRIGGNKFREKTRLVDLIPGTATTSTIYFEGEDSDDEEDEEEEETHIKQHVSTKSC